MTAELKGPQRVGLLRVLRLFLPYRGRLAVLILLIVGASLVSMALPFLLREIVDVALPQARTGLLTALSAGMAGVVVLSTGLGVLQSYLTVVLGQRVMQDLRIGVYNHLQRMSPAFFTTARTGEIQSRISNDIGGIQATITSTATVVVGSVTTVLASLVAMVALDPELTVLSLAILPLFVWISRKVGAERRGIVMEYQRKLAVTSALVEESLSVSGFLLGRTMGRTSTLNAEFAADSRALTDLAVRSTMVGRWRQSTIAIIMGTMPVIIYWAAGVIGHQSQDPVSIGTLIAFTSLQQGLFGPAVSLLQVGISIQSSMALFDRVFEYLDLPVGVPEPADPKPLPHPKGRVELRGVHFHYPGSTTGLSGIDVDIAPGEHLAVVGTTGAGKTTLGYLITRLCDPTSGTVTVDGVDVRDLGFETLAATVGLVSQDTYLFHTTIADNLRFAKAGATDGELVAAAKAAHIHDLISSLPEGYRTIVGERGYRFSGGEKQRLAVARTVLRDPPVLVLDEATSALDADTERHVQRALAEMSGGRTTITITHRLSTVVNADRIIVLERGRIVEHGSHTDLLAHSGRYAALLRPDHRERPRV
ncbi:putative multidrug export ATP-binding/permease protein [Streptomyces sp. ADI92-24]|uniref:ABC transporter ATP-binding protein n=1 Tax=Streptomyces sp. ADI92-24 TaxID=1522756 RepID=UPI000FA9D135|nr:ABC transporter ATP-binding protein [Streptomyces sp. ADI92-24]RPK34566.1 putative multidrug export ATP-binding/permease protein [Streptomyces sp. ADI92-24]